MRYYFPARGSGTPGIYDLEGKKWLKKLPRTSSALRRVIALALFTFPEGSKSVRVLVRVFVRVVCLSVGRTVSFLRVRGLMSFVCLFVRVFLFFCDLYVTFFLSLVNLFCVFSSVFQSFFHVFSFLCPNVYSLVCCSFHPSISEFVCPIFH